MGVVLSTVFIFSMFWYSGCTGVAPEHEEGKATPCSILCDVSTTLFIKKCIYHFFNIKGSEMKFETHLSDPA